MCQRHPRRSAPIPSLTRVCWSQTIACSRWHWQHLRLPEGQAISDGETRSSCRLVLTSLVDQATLCSGDCSRCCCCCCHCLRHPSLTLKHPIRRIEDAVTTHTATRSDE